jgi:hypothetical protein
MVVICNGRLDDGTYFTQGGGRRVFYSEGIKIEGGRERKDRKWGGRGGRGGEKEYLPFISIAYFASSL